MRLLSSLVLDLVITEVVVMYDFGVFVLEPVSYEHQVGAIKLQVTLTKATATITKATQATFVKVRDQRTQIYLR